MKGIVIMSRSLALTKADFDRVLPVKYMKVQVWDTKAHLNWEGEVDKVETLDVDGESVRAFRVNHVWYRYSDKKPVYSSPWLEGLEVRLIMKYRSKTASVADEGFDLPEMEEEFDFNTDADWGW